MNRRLEMIFFFYTTRNRKEICITFQFFVRISMLHVYHRINELKLMFFATFIYTALFANL